MDKRARLERAIAGEAVDRAPVYIYRHFPGDDLRAADLARSVRDYARAFDWDLAVVAPDPTYLLTDYGLQTEWRGDPDGRYARRQPLIGRSLDWTLLRPLDPQRGGPGRALEALRLLLQEVEETIPVVLAVSSPLSQARLLAGEEAFAFHLRTETDRLLSGLTVLTENMQRLMEQLRRLPVAGILYDVPEASYAILSEPEFEHLGLSFDLKLFGEAPAKWWLNVLQLPAQAPMFKFARQYQAQAVVWGDQDSDPNLAIGKTLVDGAVAGGLSRHAHLLHATPLVIERQVREALASTGGRRLIVTACGPAPLTSPVSNLRAVRQAVEEPS